MSSLQAEACALQKLQERTEAHRAAEDERLAAVRELQKRLAEAEEQVQQQAAKLANTQAELEKATV